MKDTKASRTKIMKVKSVNESGEKKIKTLKTEEKIAATKLLNVLETSSTEVMEQDIQAGDGSNTTLYVGNLHHKLGFKQFKMHFAQFGNITKCYLSETGIDHSNKGFGFVTYETELEMKQALEAQHQLKGTVAEVKISISKPKKLEKVSKKRKDEDDSNAGPPSKKMCKPLKHEVYAGGFPSDTSINEIKEHFSQFGEVVNVFEPKKLDGKNLKYVFVAFKKASSLQAALAAEDHVINETHAVVKLKRKDGVTVDTVAVDKPVSDKKASSEVLRNADPAAFERTLFVGHLDYKTTAATVLEYFSKKGKVIGLTMPRHPRVPAQSKGFALVEFDTTVAFEKALRKRNPKIDEKSLKISPSQEPKTKDAKKVAGGDPRKHELFVAEIPSNINNKALEIHFSSYGQLVAVNRPMRQLQRKLRNYAFIQFYTRESLDAALADGTHKIAGEPLIVRESRGEGKKKAGKGTVKNEVSGIDDDAADEREEKEEEDEEEDDEDEDMDDSDE